MAKSHLQELAEFLGVILDDSPELRNVPEQVRALLAALLHPEGQTIKDENDAKMLLEKLHQQMLRPVQVYPEKKQPLIWRLVLPEKTDHPFQWRLEEESGRILQGQFEAAHLPQEDIVSHTSRTRVTRRLELDIELPCGYHHFHILQGASSEPKMLASQLLIITPESCYIPPGLTGTTRVWGIGVHLHAIRSRHNWCMGDFSDLGRILSWSAENGAATVQVGPLHQLDSESLQADNPYAPSCRSMLNEMYLDIEAIEDMAECEKAKEQVAEAEFQARLTFLRNQEHIDYRTIFRIKKELLRKLWDHFSMNHLNPDTARGKAFRNFQRQGGERLHYAAAYAALTNYFLSKGFVPRNWGQWPSEYHNPHSEAVQNFICHHENELGFYTYCQWQATLQLNNIGRRSMELGLKIGFMAELPYSPSRWSFETWYHHEDWRPGLLVSRHDRSSSYFGSLEEIPVYWHNNQLRNPYGPFIEAIQHTMAQAGAVIVKSLDNYFQTSVSLENKFGTAKATLHFPGKDLLGILALESWRNRCLVLTDGLEGCSESQRDTFLQMGIFIRQNLFINMDYQDNLQDIKDFPASCMLSTTSPFLMSMKAFWSGSDIELLTAEKLFANEAEKEDAILRRASQRAQLLITLHHHGLLPEGRALDPAGIAELDQPLMLAVQMLMARSPAKIHLISFNDLLGVSQQPVPPDFSQRSYWKMRYGEELESIVEKSTFQELFQILCNEREFGVVQPSKKPQRRENGSERRIPISFYRLQLNKNFTFKDAAAVVPYLHELGISHCYVSPFLEARPGSPHGYDITNHGALNPEIGSREDFESFIAVLDRHSMALLLDIVPNHMGIGSDNQWWMDILENGQSSSYANFFDINWRPQQTELSGRVMLPILGGHYGEILENGELRLAFETENGHFSVWYADHQFPIDPQSYSLILSYDLKRLAAQLGQENQDYLEFQNLISSFTNLPGQQESSAERRQARLRDKETGKRILTRICQQKMKIRRFIEENIILFNGEPGRAESYDLLHDLLERQAYRLAYWRVAADEINYRRFFDINDLAGLRMEEMEVFNRTHQLVLDLIATGKVEGLRVDHPDGLYDPRQYFNRLQTALTVNTAKTASSDSVQKQEKHQSIYIVAEKILADFEHLPTEWEVCGTTGYDFSNIVTGLFIDTHAEKELTSLYHRFIGKRLDLDRLLYENKKLIIHSSMAGELNVLTSILYRLAQGNRRSRDFTLNRLRNALTEIIACFPVYRTYIHSERIHHNDVRYIEWALAMAKQKQQLDDLSIFEFIKKVLLLETDPGQDNLDKRLDFVMKFQQLSGPVMAKGLEDTTFYTYNRLLSLNEVGGTPKRFGVSLAAFHRTNLDRLHYWPHSMLNSSTHDSKRSEDVRARISVLSEFPSAWAEHVSRWSRINRSSKTLIDGVLAPTRNDEYALYQTLLGAWPMTEMDETAHRSFVDRIEEAMLKACREAKTNTSWINPNTAYEKALRCFIAKNLHPSNKAFWESFHNFQPRIDWFGMFNSLSQVFLKLVAPGVPDVYQGTELWHFCLVDPDNRRPVDFQRRRSMLKSLQQQLSEDPSVEMKLQQEMLTNLHDGRAKLYTMHKTLKIRQAWAELFAHGNYIPLEVIGTQKHHLCAFARKHEDQLIVVAAPRLYGALLNGRQHLPLGESVWLDTALKVPPEIAAGKFENIFGVQETIKTENIVGSSLATLPAARLFASWPVALLNGTTT